MSTITINVTLANGEFRLIKKKALSTEVDVENLDKNDLPMAETLYAISNFLAEESIKMIKEIKAKTAEQKQKEKENAES